LVSAAGSDPQAAGLLAGYTRQREQGQGLIARSLARLSALRPGMSERDAADVIHAVASPEVYRLLAVDRGWSPGRFQEWLGATLVSQLLPAAPQLVAPQPAAAGPAAPEPALTEGDSR
jgi:hypothetical protein